MGKLPIRQTKVVGVGRTARSLRGGVHVAKSGDREKRYSVSQYDNFRSKETASNKPQLLVVP